MNEQVEQNGGILDKTLARLRKECRAWVKVYGKAYPPDEKARLDEWDPLADLLILALENRANPLFYFQVQKELAKYIHSDLRAPDIALNTGNVMVAIKQFSAPDAKKVVEVKAEKVQAIAAKIEKPKSTPPKSAPPPSVKPTTQAESKSSITKSFKLDDDVPPPKK